MEGWMDVCMICSVYNIQNIILYNSVILVCFSFILKKINKNFGHDKKMKAGFRPVMT